MKVVHTANPFILNEKDKTHLNLVDSAMNGAHSNEFNCFD